MAQIPRAEPGLICPLHKKDVSKVCHRCAWWGMIKGKSHNTGEEFDEWRCAIAMMPSLLIETAYQSRHGAAATESMRNEIVRRMDNPEPVAIRKMLE